MNPTAVRRDEVPAELVERESHVIKEPVMAEGKPAAVSYTHLDVYKRQDILVRMMKDQFYI